MPEPTAADLKTVADRLDQVIASGEPEKTKALLRLLIAELRVNSRAKIQPTYNVLTPAALARGRGLRNVRKSGPCRNRTCNLGLKRPLLCRLS
jgi:hypothetical protein